MRRFMITAACLALVTAMACKDEAPAEKPQTTQTPPAAPEPSIDEPSKPDPSAPPTVFTGDAAKGEAVFTKICVACHAVDGKGNGGMTAPDFTKDNRFAKPEPELLKSIAEGKQGKVGVMPAQAGLISDQEMKDALAFMAKSFGG